MHQLQALATHNSYHVEKEGNVIPQWMYTYEPLEVQLEQYGVRSFELDTNYSNGLVDVFHVPGIDNESTCSPFTDCLQVIKTWSDDNPGHQPIFIHLEPKDDEFDPTGTPFDTYVDAVDAKILEVWPRERIITPDDVQGDAATLREAVTTNGWPTLGEARNKILFYLDEGGPFRDAYSNTGDSVAGRIIFPDFGTDHALSAVTVINGPESTEIPTAVQAGFIVRTRADGLGGEDAATRRPMALSSGAQILTTDYPVTWGGIEAFSIPEGAPSRCNPLNAPADCTSADIEAL